MSEQCRQSNDIPWELRQATVARFIIKSETIAGQIEISLIWRRSVTPPEEVRDQALEELRLALADVLN